jgi:NhaP-type Na+/H+ or K+/H+ antiporter
MFPLHDSPSLAIAAIVALGVGAQYIAWRVRLPAILPLIAIGILVGPIFGVLVPSEFISSDLLLPVVSLAVGLILFEGGLTLRIPELKEVRSVVRRLVSVGALVTWLGATAAAVLIAGLDISLAFLFGALVIVTGPTVIGPLLRNVKPVERVSNVLKWEGILIDPVGVVVALLVFEFLLIDNRSEALGQTLLLLLQVAVVGTLIGLASGFLLSVLLRRRLIPHYLINVTSLALVFAAFGISNALATESGLLATTVMGMVLANRRVPNVREILDFKETLSVLLISMLFIVLAANIAPTDLVAALSWRNLLLVLAIMLIVRPLNVFISAAGSPMTLKEKLFVSWIAPRGIVAAAVTALFAFELSHEGFVGAEVLEPLVFMVIVGTVVLNSLTAKPLATALGVVEPDPQGFLIVGAHPFARTIARFLKGEGLMVTLADTNWSNVATARVDGLNAYYGSLLSDISDDEVRLSGIGRLLALTSNDEANALTARKYARDFGADHVYQLPPSRTGSARTDLGDEELGKMLFGEQANYAELERRFEDGAVLKKTSITEQFDLEAFASNYGDDYLPLFVIRGGQLRVVTPTSAPPEPGSTLVALVYDEVAEPNPEADERA